MGHHIWKRWLALLLFSSDWTYLMISRASVREESAEISLLLDTNSWWLSVSYGTCGAKRCLTGYHAAFPFSLQLSPELSPKAVEEGGLIILWWGAHLQSHSRCYCNMRVARVNIWKQSASRHLCPCRGLWWCPWCYRGFCSWRVSITKLLLSFVFPDTQYLSVIKGVVCLRNTKELHKPRNN